MCSSSLWLEAGSIGDDNHGRSLRKEQDQEKGGKERGEGEERIEEQEPEVSERPGVSLPLKFFG